MRIDGRSDPVTVHVVFGHTRPATVPTIEDLILGANEEHPLHVLRDELDRAENRKGKDDE